MLGKEKKGKKEKNQSTKNSHSIIQLTFFSGKVHILSQKIKFDSDRFFIK